MLPVLLVITEVQVDQLLQLAEDADHGFAGAGGQLAAIQRQELETIFALPEGTDVIDLHGIAVSQTELSRLDNVDVNLGLANVQRIQEGKIFHHQLQAVLTELCVGHIENLEIAEFSQGDDDTELVAVHECRVGDIEKAEVLKRPKQRLCLYKY